MSEQPTSNPVACGHQPTYTQLADRRLDYNAQCPFCEIERLRAAVVCLKRELHGPGCMCEVCDARAADEPSKASVGTAQKASNAPGGISAIKVKDGIE